MNGLRLATILGVVVLGISLTSTTASKYPKDSVVYNQWQAMFVKLSPKCKVLANDFAGKQTGNVRNDCTAIATTNSENVAIVNGCTRDEYLQMKFAVCIGIGKYSLNSDMYKRWEALYPKISQACETVADNFYIKQTGNQGTDCNAISEDRNKMAAMKAGCTDDEYTMMKHAVCGNAGVTILISWSLTIACLLVQALKH